MNSNIRFYKEHTSLFVLISLITVCVFSFYDLLRPVKASLILAFYPQGGIELIPYLKVWGILPGSILITFVYMKVISKLGIFKTFRYFLLFFIAFYLIFLLVLYPNAKALEIHTFVDYLQLHLPEGLHRVFYVIRYWHLSLFYVLTEMWGAIIISTLFWGLNNQIFNLKEAKDIYPIFIVIANSSAIVAGYIGTQLSSLKWRLHGFFGAETSSWDQAFSLMVIMGIFWAIVTFFLLGRLKKYVVKKEEIQNVNLIKEEKMEMGLIDCFREFKTSSYLRSIAIIVLCYNIFFNLIDVLWSYYLKNLCKGDPTLYLTYSSQTTMYTGILSLAFGLLCKKIVTKFGWRFSALLTPRVMIVASLGFFGLLFWNKEFLALAVFVGAIEMCLARGLKYSIFDATKEMAYIPLDRETKVKAKAVVDGIGGRSGKSLGSLIYQILFLFHSTLATTTPYIAVIIAGVLWFWNSSVKTLAKEFHEKT